MGGGLSKKKKCESGSSHNASASTQNILEHPSTDGDRPAHDSSSHQAVDPVIVSSQEEQGRQVSPRASNLMELQTLVTRLQHQISLLHGDHEAVKHQLKEMITEQQQQVWLSLFLIHKEQDEKLFACLSLHPAQL
jgi:hypothetical protein